MFPQLCKIGCSMWMSTYTLPMDLPIVLCIDCILLWILINFNSYESSKSVMMLPSLPFLHSAFNSYRVGKWTQFFHMSLFNYESPGRVRWIRGLSLTGLFFLHNVQSKPSLGRAVVAHAFNPSTWKAEAGGSL